MRARNNSGEIDTSPTLQINRDCGVIDVFEWEEIESTLVYLDQFEDLACESVCDAMSAALAMTGVQHSVQQGAVRNIKTGEVVLPHCWIELPETQIVDIRLRMWLGDEGKEGEYIPHGIFYKSDFKWLEWCGATLSRSTPMNVIDELIEHGRC